MADTKLPEQDDGPEHPWTLVKQLRMRDLVNAIKQIELDDFQHLASIARGRPSNLETYTLLCKEFIKTRTGRAILSVVTAIVCCTIFISAYSTKLLLPLLAGLHLIHAGPAPGSVTTAQSTSSAGAVIGTLQSAAMAGYEDPVAVAFAQGTVIAVTICGVYKLWNMYKHENAERLA